MLQVHRVHKHYGDRRKEYTGNKPFDPHQF